MPVGRYILKIIDQVCASICNTTRSIDIEQSTTLSVMRLFIIGLTFQHFELSNFHLDGQSYLLVPAAALLLVPHSLLVRIPSIDMLILISASLAGLF